MPGNDSWERHEYARRLDCTGDILEDAEGPLAALHQPQSHQYRLRACASSSAGRLVSSPSHTYALFRRLLHTQLPPSILLLMSWQVGQQGTLSCSQEHALPQIGKHTSILSLYEFQTEGRARLPTCTVASTLQSSYCTVTVGTSRLTLHTDNSPGRLDLRGLIHISDLIHTSTDNRLAMLCSDSTPCIALLELLHHQLVVLVFRLQSCMSRTGVKSLFFSP